MEAKDSWIPYNELNFSDPKFNVFSIDTRDFYAGYRWDDKGHRDYNTLKKYPHFFHTEQEVKNLLDKYYNESGGEGKWRMFSFKINIKI